MHRQSANFAKFKINSLNLAPFLLLNPVVPSPDTPEQFGLGVTGNSGRGSELEMERERQSCEYTRPLAPSESERRRKEELRQMADSPRARERRLTYGSALPMPTAGPSLPPSLRLPLLGIFTLSLCRR